MVIVKESESKVVFGKKNITIKDAIVKDLRFVDETGDVTEQVLAAIPSDYETVTVKISLEIPDYKENIEE